MKMRPDRFDSLLALEPVFGRVSSLLGRSAEVAHNNLERAALLRDRLAGELRKYPKLTAGADAIGLVWTSLVASFCAMIDPYLSRFFPDVRLVAVTTASGGIELHRVVKSAASPLGPLADLDATEMTAIAHTKWTGIELRLRSEQLLQRTISLPVASRDFLGPIIEHKLERLTPWRPERVLYGYRLLDDVEAGAVTVALTATSKDFVAAPLQALGEAGLVPTAIGTQDEPLAEPLGVNLLRGAPKNPRTDSRRMVSRVALGTFAVLSFVYLATSMWATSALDEQHDAGIRLLKARRLLKAASMGALGDREKALLDAKQPEKAVVVLIDRLATAIPQDTFLRELAVTPTKLRLVGVSGNAPALIGELEATGLVNVRFTSAVTREKDQRDSFEITADRAASARAEAP